MAKRNLSRFSIHRIVTMAVIVLGVVGIGFTVFASQQTTQTESEATGATGRNLDTCAQYTKGLVKGSRSKIVDRDYGGGIELFNGDNQTGGDRLFCVVKKPGSTNVKGDKNLSRDNRGSNSQIYQDIWGNFNYKTNSFSIIADAKCNVTARLYNSKANYEVNKPFAERSLFNQNNLRPKTEHYQLNKKNRNKAAAIKLIVSCTY